MHNRSVLRMWPCLVPNNDLNNLLQALMVQSCYLMLLTLLSLVDYAHAQLQTKSAHAVHLLCTPPA